MIKGPMSMKKKERSEQRTLDNRHKMRTTEWLPSGMSHGHVTKGPSHEGTKSDLLTKWKPSRSGKLLMKISIKGLAFYLVPSIAWLTFTSLLRTSSRSSYRSFRPLPLTTSTQPSIYWRNRENNKWSCAGLVHLQIFCQWTFLCSQNLSTVTCRP
jgi:hypothetical protein